MADDKPYRSRGGRWTTLSYAHHNPDEVGSTTLQVKAPRLTKGFEEQRCTLNAKQLADQGKTEAERRRDIDTFKAKRRGSEMVKKDRPKPVHKPSPSLAFGIDRAAFNHEWADEYQSAKRANRLATAKQVARADSVPTQQMQQSSRDAFKAARRSQAGEKEQSRAVQR